MRRQVNLSRHEIEAYVIPTLQSQLEAIDASHPERISMLVDLVLSHAIKCLASDIHFEPTAQALDIRFRIDGVLHRQAALPREVTPNVIARLKVLAELLTYRQDVPQEGRLAQARFGADMRVSTFPTVHGEKAAIRIFGSRSAVLEIDELGMSPVLLNQLRSLFAHRTGAIFLTGPSGSGKTTTLYACLRYLLRESAGGRHIVTIEDPVEQILEGITQSHARPGTEFDFARGLRSLLRQDPEILMVGEVRDADTAHITVEAALTGHLVLTTLHAGSACGVISRLLEMGIEPYLLTSGVIGILNQRLVRRLCESCRRQVGTQWQAVGCERCVGTGFRQRALLAELVQFDDALRQAILVRADTATLEKYASSTERATIWTSADAAITKGITTESEILRVLGPRPA